MKPHTAEIEGPEAFQRFRERRKKNAWFQKVPSQIRSRNEAVDMAQATIRDWERWRADWNRGKKGEPASAGAN
jgi:hypothetical protein